MKVFVAHSVRDRDLVAGLVTILRESGHDVFVAEEIATTGDLFSAISAAIRSSDLLVALVTASNLNVLYELGLAAGAGVPTLIIARPGEPLPAVLATVPYVQLTGDMLRDAQSIARRAKELEGLPRAAAPRFSSAEDALRAATRDPAVLEALAPSEFERLVAELFKERGYEVSATPYTRDTGVDLVITSPEDKQVVLVEVKKLSRQSRVSVEAVRRLLDAVSVAGGSLGMLVSTSGYTAAALALAAGTPIVLRTLEEILAAKPKWELIVPEETSVVHQEGMRLWRAGQLDQALERFQQALGLKERFANRSASASSIHMIGVVYAQKRDWANAIRFMLLSLEIDAEDGHDDGVAKSLNDIAIMMGDRGDAAAKRTLVRLGNRVIEHFRRGPRLELNEALSLCEGLPSDLAGVKSAVAQLLTRRNADVR